MFKLTKSSLFIVFIGCLSSSISSLCFGQRRPQEILLAINEFMASNDSFIQDSQGGYDDWIEIHNYGAYSTDIGGMYLTDDLSVPTQWQIPDTDPALTTIPAGGFLLIWADDNIADDGLHANFKLSAGGEEIALFDTDGVTVLDSIIFGEQTTDVSFGRYPDAGENLRFFGQPTPGATNIEVYEDFIADVQFSHTSDIYIRPFRVTLATETEDVVIYCTLDGSEPYDTTAGGRFPQGVIYTEPITISETTLLRAKAIKAGWKPSEIGSQMYLFPDLDIYNFSSNLPIAIIETFSQGINENSQTPAFIRFIEPTTGGRARLDDPPDFSERMGINVRGKSSTGFAKKQYHLEAWDDNDQDKDVSILGLPTDSDWILQGPYSDKSLMRNYLTYQWSNDIGRYAVRTRYIEVFLNTGGGGISSSDYIGVYVLMEKIKRGENRVDIAELEPSHNGEPEISGGYIFKKDKLDTGEPTFSTSTGQTLIYLEPSGTEITQPQQEWLRSYLNEFETVLNRGDFTDPVNGYAKYIDVDSFIDHHILVELCKNIDGFRLSTYMHKDRGVKLNMGPVWDYNLSLGNANYLQGWIASGWYFSQLSNAEYPWWRRLFEDPAFCLRYADRWFALRRNLFATERLLGDIDETAALLDEAQVRNFERWRILGSYVWPNWFIADTYDEEINWMKGWLEDRLTWMDSQIATEFGSPPPTLIPAGGYFDNSLDLTMNARYGTIYYTLDGNDPSESYTFQSTMEILVEENAEKSVIVPVRGIGDTWKDNQTYNDRAWIRSTGSPGGVGYKTDSGYDGLISLDVQRYMYNVNATCYIRIPFTFSGNVENFDIMTLNIRYDDGFIAYLNGVEIAKRNFSGRPSWNSSADTTRSDAEAITFESIDISDFFGTLVPGGNLLAIHGLNVSPTSPDFLISAELLIDKTDDTNVDPSGAIRYTNPITLTQSTQVKARVLSGRNWSALNEAFFTIGPVAENLRITEIMYHPQSLNDTSEPNEEFIELTNIGDETINLNLARFTNGIDFTFPNIDLRFGENVVVVQDRNAFEARYSNRIDIAGQYNGSLNNAGEKITLEDTTGRTILDFTYRDGWHSLTDGQGFSLTVVDPTHPNLDSWDDSDAWRASVYIGGSPGQDDSGILPNPGDVVINELLANSPGGAPDWIELYNKTEAVIDLSGWFLSDSDDNLFKYGIALGTTIEPFGYLVFYEDLHFGNTDDAGCYEPFALGNNGERVILSSAQGGIPTGYRESEDFGASAGGVSIGRYDKSGTGNINFVALEFPTPGSENAYPLVGPIVISEIMYHPDWPDDGTYTNDQYEYLKLQNISAEPVTLFDEDKAASWTFTSGIEFTFPTDSPVTIPAGGSLFVVRHPGAFSWRYPQIQAKMILGPYSGNLSNAGERIELSMPGDVDNDGERYYVRIDRVTYSDGSHPENCPGSVDLWPTGPDGSGQSLIRISLYDYGNAPENWQGASPTPDSRR
ncbi:MAG: CotH kinase family protein [Sedimentisphaerales bacterium]|nr:CotH kinase family protein [Sedimentisphaerales bacterium]